MSTLGGVRTELSLLNGRLAGRGGRMLVERGREARFVLLGEQHGVSEIPAIAAAMFEELAPAGFEHFGIEIGWPWADAFNAALASAPTSDTVRGIVRSHPPGPPFYALREEAELLARVVRATNRRDGALWGLDFDVYGDRFALRRLRELVPAPDRQKVDRVIQFTDSLQRAALAVGNVSMLPMYGAPDTLFDALGRALAPAASSEASRILDLLRETVAINRLFASGRGWESNLRRTRHNKQLLAARLDAAERTTGVLPRVMLKFGLVHMMRGRSLVNTYDLGTLAAEVAEARGERTFHVLVMAGKGDLQAGFDAHTMSYAAPPVGGAIGAWAEPFYAASEQGRWSVFDLEKLRPALARGRIMGLTPALTQILWGYDAVVVLNGSHPAGILE